MLTVRGTLVALDPSDPERHARGSVVISDAGLVESVTTGSAKPPGAVDAGSSWVFPGLIDLHSHIAYNTLPLWTEPSQTTPFLHHNDWTDESTYQSAISWPAWTLARCEPEALLAYVELKALVGGTTAIQGSPGGGRPRDGWLVRNIDDEAFGTSNRNMLFTSALTMKPEQLRQRATDMAAGRGFVYHCGEGQVGSIAAREYDDARAAGCLTSTFIAIHMTSVTDFRAWAAKPGGVVWSPFSNLWLYGQTTDVTAARAAGLTVCLGSDWSPSGSPNVLTELKVAKLWNAEAGWGLTDRDLVEMVTANPGDLLARCWPHPAGRLVPGALGDLTVIAKRTADPFADLVSATERDVRLVVVEGTARFGTPALMASAGAVATTAVTVAGQRRVASIPKPGDPSTPWPLRSIRAALDAVRADPAKALQAAERKRLQGAAGGLDPVLDLELDMPFGGTPDAGPPKDPATLVIPPLTALTVTKPWLASVKDRGFHGGVLDGLQGFYA